MKFAEVSIKNFLTIRDTKISLKDRGLQVLQGVNLTDPSANSNGSGKSSLVDAICWGIYGTTARGVKSDAVINRAAGKDCCVMLRILMEDDTQLVIARYRKHRVGKNRVTLYREDAAGGASIEITKGTDAETQKEIERLIGCSRAIFMASIYAGQESMPDLPNMNDKALKELIEEAAGLGRMEAAYKLARERHKECMEAVHAYSRYVGAARDRCEAREETIRQLEDKALSWGEGKAERVNEARIKCGEIEKRMGDLIARAKIVIKETVHIADELAEVDTKLKAMDELSSKAKQASDEKLHWSKVLFSAEHNAKVAAENLAEAQRNLAHIEAHKGDAVCESCGQHVPGTAEELLKNAEENVAALSVVNSSMQERLAKCQKEYALADEADKQATAAVPDLHKLLDKSKKLNEQCASNRAEVELAYSAKAKFLDVRDMLSKLKAEVCPFTAMINEAKGHLTNLEAEMHIAIQNHAASVAKADVASATATLFGPTGLRAHIIDTVTPFLNERTQEYLTHLSDGSIRATWTTLTKTAAGELRENFSISVTNDRGGDSFNAISGGEKRKVRLACALALQDLVATRANNPINLFIGDEIDDAVDESGLERLMGILEEKAKAKGTVIVISHRSLSDWCDEVTTVTKKEEFVSEVEGSLVVA